MGSAGFIKEVRVYAAVLGLLLLLTAVTVAMAGVHFGSQAINTAVALLIASSKAALVALFFMHLLHDRPLNALIFVVGLLMLGVFLILTLIDVDTRPLVEPRGRRVVVAGQSQQP